MNNTHRIMICTAMLAGSFTAGAQPVYESVDQQGVVEFSDEPSTGAKEIDVRPNVVDVAPAPPLQPSLPAATTGAQQAPAGGVQPEVVHEDADADVEYYGDYERRRDALREPVRREPGREVVQPVRPDTGREAVRQGGVRR